jgi:hypothetical protein
MPKKQHNNDDSYKYCFIVLVGHYNEKGSNRFIQFSSIYSILRVVWCNNILRKLACLEILPIYNRHITKAKMWLNFVP